MTLSPTQKNHRLTILSQRIDPQGKIIINGTLLRPWNKGADSVLAFKGNQGRVPTE
jgi:hypothetical protein